jgi:hypothetical protein
MLPGATRDTTVLEAAHLMREKHLERAAVI